MSSAACGDRGTAFAVRGVGAVTAFAVVLRAYREDMNLLGHLGGAIRRHAQLADATISLAVFIATVLTATMGTVAICAAAAACGVLALRRPHPVITLGVSAVSAEVVLHETTGPAGS